MDKKIGERVRARRLEIGMSQERLAELLGVTFQQVQKYEKGANRIAASRLFDISCALDLPITDFFAGFKGAVKSASGAVFSEALSTPGARELVRRYAGLRTAKLRRQVLEIVRVIDEGAD
ncbi:MAG TPA: helix-turn-helix transcriptional regulator [Vitreimonas sp.]|uniref:helix-turn-helix domain-containing protein n=1 Tax=Vitreimonas sp. TaxID=3069702 RepID=UPI002D4EBC31|nr:helix-turn-helix transcriptional regulator [Vitreimonas sp.]HYD86014.1 helix-turn-helix transcriptional regulator [Vitreimonas sp.]